MRISVIGTRGVPACYGGFETAVEEVGARLVQSGHEVTVYCRQPGPDTHLGMHRVVLPALRARTLETLSHTAMAVAHSVLKRRADVAIVMNAANAPYVRLLRWAGIPVAVHVDGLEWRRGKWRGAGRQYYRWAERRAVRDAHALIADAEGIARYYEAEFGAPTRLIAYGAPLLDDVDPAHLAAPVLGGALVPGGFHLAVARFEPENHVHLIVEAYRRSSATAPLIVVGSAPYSAEYTRFVRSLAAGDERIRFVGGSWDAGVLNALYAHAISYVHGHSVGGTNPSLLRAMGAGTAVAAYDVEFNREVLGETGWFFRDAVGLARCLEHAEADEPDRAERARATRRRAGALYRWDDVAAEYERLCHDLFDGLDRRIHDASRHGVLVG